jgi:hypothetical protein
MGANRRLRSWLDSPSNLLQSSRSSSPAAAWVRTDGVRFYRFVRRHLRYSCRRARIGERGKIGTEEDGISQRYSSPKKRRHQDGFSALQVLLGEVILRHTDGL